MTDGVRPVGPVPGQDRRESQRREAERRAASTGRDLVSTGAVQETPDPASPAASTAPLDPAAAFSAHLMGQTGQRKGLKGGPPLMDAARATYLGAEYSGGKDRRPPAGRVKKTDV